ncbi:tRNA (N6-threonylcarbamoyladenosine(37)-N6)-methyltransferase TrmO [Aliidiomarina shirensis]|uniref:tRNA (N6-threonylcarbamoyladenosine(37)-N6)-methyltransferase TrmO n=1 Tax=Aliidiomarina shirensis TaxID=1048642 RepID=A0A432WYT9_9GAMM|nr:tRNA (N6-threonylcarbamoyladenosine(37)-N6)-methyltransferase TrmO [Aliidiomarina shirensis]RUO38851.1 tRNA (N6-threonylcarbamoyladenosine(37)-N6)-methyltransferase TrmO [Aliidiomarina shirensis]
MPKTESSKNSENSEYRFKPIGFIESPYRQKFAIPRQPGLVPSARGIIHFTEEFAHSDCVRGIEAFSHLWLTFVFHETAAQGWKPLVRPPRLGGNMRKGVFATRSTFRPNPIGLSVVELVAVEANKLIVRGLDLLHGTPILDIKPYLPYSDSVSGALGGYADANPTTGMSVSFTPAAEAAILQHQHEYPELRQLISEVLQQDPRPGYQREQSWDKEYGMHLYDFNIKWRVIANDNHVISIS